MKLTMYFLRFIAAMSLLYMILILKASGTKTSFLWFWPFLTVLCTGASFLLPYLHNHPKRGLVILGNTLSIAMWIVAAIFLIFEVFLIGYSHKQPPKEADYVIVLGAQVRGSRPSKTLQMRINAAAKYLTENQETKVICSGGQGSGEDITEALAIKQGLLELGIDEDRIFLEELSTNTVENLRFCKPMIADPYASVVIITNDFHTYRAHSIAKKLGYKNAAMGSANTFMTTTIQYYVREFFAVIKDKLVGNI